MAFTFAGIQALGASSSDISGFEAGFKDDMLIRAASATIGDSGPSAPSAWSFPFNEPATIHMLLIVASDSTALLDAACDEVREDAIRDGAFVYLHEEIGNARSDAPGYEHFGFKDGVSQPRPQVTAEDEPSTDGTLPWDFILQAQVPTAAPPPSQAPPTTPQSFGYPTETTITQSPAPSTAPVAWMHEGSYIVFRKVSQDVKGFAEFVNQTAPNCGLAPEILSAKFVGRYKSGAPLAAISSLPSYNPAIGDPAKSSTPIEFDPTTINAFDYSADPSGALMPKAAHIQKSNPRLGPNSRPRLMRRGIAYGESLAIDGLDGTGAGPGDERGLLFISYQSSIEQQFEFITQQWVNNAAFPVAPAGQDPIIGQSSSACTFQLPGAVGPTLNVPRFVTTRGSLYMFAPSIAGLHYLSSLANSG